MDIMSNHEELARLFGSNVSEVPIILASNNTSSLELLPKGTRVKMSPFNVEKNKEAGMTPFEGYKYIKSFDYNDRMYAMEEGGMYLRNEILAEGIDFEGGE